MKGTMGGALPEPGACPSPEPHAGSRQWVSAGRAQKGLQGVPAPRGRRGADGRQLGLFNWEPVAWQPAAAHYRGHSD